MAQYKIIIQSCENVFTEKKIFMDKQIEAACILNAQIIGESKYFNWVQNDLPKELRQMPSTSWEYMVTEIVQ